jgi:DNA-binding IclR family transcriptional regulator
MGQIIARFAATGQADKVYGRDTGPGGLPIGELQSQLGVPASTLAFHLRGLVAAALVDQQKEGRIVRCTPNLVAVNATLAFVKARTVA